MNRRCSNQGLLGTGNDCHPYHIPSRVILNLKSSILLTYLLIYLLTPWCTLLLEKLTGLQLVKKFPAFYGTRMFITALTSVRHLSLPWASPIQSTYPHSHLLEIHPNIHPSTPRSPQWSLSLRFPHQDPIRPPLLTHTRHMLSPSHSSRASPTFLNFFNLLQSELTYLYNLGTDYELPEDDTIVSKHVGAVSYGAL